MKNSPMDKEAIIEKINNGNVKMKGARDQKPKAEKPKVEKPKAEKAKAKPAIEREKLQFSGAQIIEAVRAVGHPASSREISDKLGIKDPDQGRAYVRTQMAAFVKDKDIVTSKPKDAKSRCTFLYSVVE